MNDSLNSEEEKRIWSVPPSHNQYDLRFISDIVNSNKKSWLFS